MYGSATCTRRPVFAIVIRHWRSSRVNVVPYARKSWTTSCPTVVARPCLQTAAEVPNVTPPCQLLSRITTHDLFPLIRLFFISAPGISRGTRQPSVMHERVAKLLIALELPISSIKLIALDLRGITIARSARFVRMQSSITLEWISFLYSLFITSKSSDNSSKIILVDLMSNLTFLSFNGFCEFMSRDYMNARRSLGVKRIKFIRTRIIHV